VQPDGTFFYWFGYQQPATSRRPIVLRGRLDRAWQGADPRRAEVAGRVRGRVRRPTGQQDTAGASLLIERDPGRAGSSTNGTLSFTATVTNSQDYSVMVRNFMAASDVRVDYIRARARVMPDPMVSVAAEEGL